MRKLLSCRFDIDTTLPMRTEMDWLIYNDSLEHAQIVLEDQELNQRGKAAFCGLPSFSLHGELYYQVQHFRGIKRSSYRPMVE